MKRVILSLTLLAAGGLSTGCGTCDPNNLLVYWTFTNASGQATTSCAQAGVTTLRVFVNGQAQLDEFGNADLSCALYGDGAVLPPVGSGSLALQVEAYDASGNLLYLDQRTVNARNCGANVVDSNLAAVQGSLTLNIAGVSACPNPGYIWYSLTDVTNNRSYSVVDGLNNPTSVPCAGSVIFDQVPFGQYRFDFVQVVTVQNNQYVATSQNCTAQPFNHIGNDAATVTLGPATVTCAGSQ